MQSALDHALLLAQKFAGRVEGFALRPAVADMVAMDPDAGLTMVAVKENDAAYGPAGRRPVPLVHGAAHSVRAIRRG